MTPGTHGLCTHIAVAEFLWDQPDRPPAAWTVYQVWRSTMSTIDGGGEGDGRYGALVGRVRSAKRPLILPNGYIGEHIAKELVLGEEQSTTESEPDGSKESDSEESEMRSGEENGLEDQTASAANLDSLSNAYTHGVMNALGESREDSLSLEAE